MLEQPLSSETNTKKNNLMDLTRQQMREFFAELGEKPFRADQLVKWIYHFGEDNFDNMTNINKKLREKLKAVAEIKAPEVAVEQRSADCTIEMDKMKGKDGVIVYPTMGINVRTGHLILSVPTNNYENQFKVTNGHLILQQNG